MEDINVLIDTPEDIAHALNNSNIEAVDCIFYSHIDPDHTMRIIEQLRFDWLTYSIGKKCKNSIKVGSFPQILDDIKCFTEDNHKVIYAPCDVKPFPINIVFKDADCLIIGNTIIGCVLKDGFILDNNNVLCNEIFVMDEIVELKKEFDIKRVVITHLEEAWGKTYDDYLELQKQYNGIEFAYDGLEINF